MTRIAPIAVGEKNAAKMLDLSLERFRSLVSDGVLPRPRKIGPYDRWDADELRALVRGQMTDGYENVRW